MCHIIKSIRNLKRYDQQQRVQLGGEWASNEGKGQWRNGLLESGLKMIVFTSYTFRSFKLMRDKNDNRKVLKE